MFNKTLIFHSGHWPDYAIKILLSLTLVCLLGPIVLTPEGLDALPLQGVVIILIPMVFGWQVGLLSFLSYLLIGTTGLPVFPGYRSGAEHLISEAGGFYFGYLSAVVAAGYLSEFISPKSFLKVALLCLGAHILVMAMGLPWFWLIRPSEEEIGKQILFYLPGIAIKTALCLLALQIIDRSIQFSNARSKS